MAVATVTVDVNDLGQYPIEVTACLRYEFDNSGFTWEPKQLISVHMTVAGEVVDVTTDVKKNTLAAASLLNAASNDDTQVYPQLKAHVREKNPMADFADALLRGHTFRIKTA